MPSRALHALLCLLACASGSLAAPAVPTKKLDTYFDALAASQLVNGSIAISEQGQLRYQRSVGFATIEGGREFAADAGTRYRLGPVSQLFTAALFMQLVEGASVTLDSPVAEFYADLPNALAITYHDLLRNRSGLADYTTAGDFESWRTKPRTHADLLSIIAGGGARFAPRERLEASATNYLLLGFVLEKVRGRSFDDILRSQLAEKHGLARTYFAGTGRSSLESISYRYVGGRWEAVPSTDPTVLGAAGGVISAPNDLARFMDALFAGRVVTPQSLSSMLDQDGGAGVVLVPRQFAGQSAQGVSGSVEGFHACVYHFPQRKISIAITTNATRHTPEAILEEVLKTLFERGYRPSTLTLKRAE